MRMINHMLYQPSYTGPNQNRPRILNMSMNDSRWNKTILPFDSPAPLVYVNGLVSLSKLYIIIIVLVTQEEL